MADRESVIERIRVAFGANSHPGDAFLQGSFEGCEPYEETRPFAGKNWREIGASFLDAHYSALSFFSEAGFRYFLPAYLIADLNDELQTADPVFHLTHGFFDLSVDLESGNGAMTVTSGKSTFLNPRRYGAATWYEYARYKLSVFTREEAGAIVAYLEYKLEVADLDDTKKRIEAALQLFWLERARSAPSANDLEAYLQREKEIQAALRRKLGG